MNIKSFIKLYIVSTLCFACSNPISKSTIEIQFVQDTLTIGHTYWWPESGPFIGPCGDEISLVFSGTVANLQEPTDDAGPLYVSQKGTIAIEQMYKIKKLNTNRYANQKYITTDCLNGLDLKVGDPILVFCYDYQGSYTLPGGKSILKITDFDDPLITSIHHYIDHNQNAIELKNDIGLWAKQGLGRKLQEVIQCAEKMSAEKTSNSNDNQ